MGFKDNIAYLHKVAVVYLPPDFSFWKVTNIRLQLHANKHYVANLLRENMELFGHCCRQIWKYLAAVAGKYGNIQPLLQLNITIFSC